MEYYYVYELTDPREDNLPFYVGITDKPEYRYNQHVYMRGHNQVKDDRIDAILADGLKPGLRVVERWTTRKEAEEREGLLIREYESHDLLLTNIQKKIDPSPPPALEKRPIDILRMQQQALLLKWKPAMLGRPVGWLQTFEIDWAWVAFLKNRELSDDRASIEDVDQFIAAFTPPPRIPTLRKKDRDHLKVWYDKAQWRVQHPGQIRPCTASV